MLLRYLEYIVFKLRFALEDVKKMLESFFEAYNKMIKIPQTRINTEFFITKENTVPAAPTSAKTVFLVRLQGLEPWTP